MLLEEVEIISTKEGLKKVRRKMKSYQEYISRREFIKKMGLVVVGGSLASGILLNESCKGDQSDDDYVVQLGYYH
jgi:hypothetical protein